MSDNESSESTEFTEFTVRMPSGTDDPLSDSEIQSYREEINRLDRVIILSLIHISEPTRR